MIGAVANAMATIDREKELSASHLQAQKEAEAKMLADQCERTGMMAALKIGKGADQLAGDEGQ